jgi:hypothetical protein
MPLYASCISYCLATSSPDLDPSIMSQPFQKAPSPSSFLNASQSLQQGDDLLYNIPEWDYPPLDEELDFLAPQLSQEDLFLECSESENLSSQVYSAEEWSLAYGSSQTSHTDPGWEVCPQTANLIPSQDVPVDPRLGSEILDPPRTRAPAERVDDPVVQTQPEPHQHVSEASITQRTVSYNV